MLPTPDQLRIITVIAFTLLIILGIGRPIYAVAAYMILVYCKLSFYYPVFAQVSAESIFAVLILIRVAAAGNLYTNLSFQTSKINKYLLWFVLCVALSFAVAWDHQYSWDNAVYHLIKSLVFYVILVGAAASKEDLQIFIWAFILMFAYLAYEPTYYFLYSSGGSEQIYGTNYIAEVGLLSGHVALANNVNQMIPIVIFLYFGVQSRLLKIVLLICLFIFFLALIGSGSRGGIIGMLVWSTCMIWFSENRLKMMLLATILLAILMVNYSSTVLQTTNRIDSSSIGERLLGLSHGITIIRKGNIVGVGPGCFLMARRHYHGFRMESHNIYGQVIGDLGIPGMAVTLLLLLEVFKSIRRIKEKLKNKGSKYQFYYYLTLGVQVSLITRLVISMASHGLYYFYWYIMAALIVVLQRLVQEDDSLGNHEASLLENEEPQITH